MTGKILTTVASVAAIFGMAVTSLAHDSFPTYASGSCGCGANGYYSGMYDYSRGYSAAGGCTNAICGYPNSSVRYDPAHSGVRGNFGVRMPRVTFPRQTPSPSSSPYFDSRTPYSDGRGRQPAFRPAPSFGSGGIRPAVPDAVQAPSIPAGMEGIAQLSPADQVAALKQRTCPVTQEPLGSMGKPIRVGVDGRSIFVCCEGCVAAIQRNPQKYLQGAVRSNVVIL